MSTQTMKQALGFPTMSDLDLDHMLAARGAQGAKQGKLCGACSLA